MTTPLQTSQLNATIELVGFEPKEIASLNGIMDRSADSQSARCAWNLCERPTVEAALKAVDRGGSPVVLCDTDRLPFAWKLLLDRFSGLPQPPLLILASRLADDRLWAEALNLGAYDVLARPFNADEAVRTLSLACQRWHQSYTA